MPFTSSNIDQALAANQLFDYPSHGSLSVDTVSLALRENNLSLCQTKQFKQRAGNIIRLVISQGDGDSLQAICQALSQLSAANYYLICEIIAPLSWMNSSATRRSELLAILQHVDLLICAWDVTQQLAQANSTSATQTSKLCKQLQITDLVAFDAQARHCIYLSSSAFAELSFNHESIPMPPTGVLSAVLASFMLWGKRSCDALVLSLAYLQQIQAIDTSATINFSLSAQRKHPTVFQWPVKLQYFPQLNTDISSVSLQPFNKTDSLKLGLYPVVDSIEWLERLLKLGIKTIQLRIKDTEPSDLEPLVAQAATLGQHYKARLFINDYWRLAIKYKCYGVHLGQEDIGECDLNAIQQAGLRLGISTHSEYEWLRAIAINPSYIAMGAVYPTLTKPAMVIGLSNLQHWCTTLAEHFPVVAIGGIKLDNIEAIIATGVGSVALVTAITHADDYRQATAQLQCIMRQHNLQE